MKTSNLTIALLWILSPPLALAGTVGFYARDFDPPRGEQLRIIRCALGEASVSGSCSDRIPQTSRVIVSVNQNPEQDSLASARERVLMLKTALQQYSDRVEIVALTPAEREEKKRSLLDKGQGEALMELTDGEEPSTEGAIAASGHEPGTTDSGVYEVIKKLGLYQDVSEDLSDLQRSLFEEGWKDFVQDLELVCPTLMSRQNCAALGTRWKEIRIATDEQRSETGRLVYKRVQSEDRWAEKFYAMATRALQGSEYYNLFKTVAEDIAARVFQGYPYGKLPHLKAVLVENRTPLLNSADITEKPLLCPAPEGSYYMNIEQYVADRFPRAFAAFLQDSARKGILAAPGLYVHNQSIEEAYAFHQIDGFTIFHQLQTRRGQLHRNIYIAARPKPLAYRVVLTDVRGQSREANVLCQIYRSRIFSTYQSIQSRKPKPLFVLNPVGSALKLDSKDLLFIGFKGNWTRSLLARQWRQTPLVSQGLDIDLFTHPTLNHKIVVARNFYGDDATVILNTFYNKGARRMIYVGTAGAVGDYQIGDMVIPAKFLDFNGDMAAFQNRLAQDYGSGLSRLLVVHENENHVSARSVFDETEATLNNWQANAIGSVDIEGIHLASFAAAHAGLQMALMFIISDQTLGSQTIEQSNAHRRLIDQSVDKLLPFLLENFVTPR